MRFGARFGGKQSNSKNLTYVPGLSPLLTFSLNLAGGQGPFMNYLPRRVLGAAGTWQRCPACLTRVQTCSSLGLPAEGQRDSVLSPCTWEHGSQQPQPQPSSRSCSARPAEGTAGQQWGHADLGCPGVLASRQLTHVKLDGESIPFTLLKSHRCIWG